MPPPVLVVCNGRLSVRLSVCPVNLHSALGRVGVVTEYVLPVQPVCPNTCSENFQSCLQGGSHTSVPASVLPAAAAHGQLTVCRFPRQCTWHDLIVARVSWSAGYCYTRRGVVCHGLLRPMAYSYAPSKVLPITGDARIVSC